MVEHPIPCNVTASHWCLIFYRISLNLFDVSFYFISWHHELSAALGTLQLKVHSRSDDMHGIASARVRLFHSQNISRRTSIFHSILSSYKAQINHEYILLYPFFCIRQYFRGIFLYLYKSNKRHGTNPVKFHKNSQTFSRTSKLPQKRSSVSVNAPSRICDVQFLFLEVMS